MSDHTKIEWADATVNAVNGCSLASPGCTNCYAMRLAGTRMKHHPTREGLATDSKAGPVWNGAVRLHEPALLQPLRWKRPRRIFWNAHGDLFHPAVPDEWIDRVFAVCALTPQHTHMILTKRSARMREHLAALGTSDWQACLGNTLRRSLATAPGGRPAWPLPNVWLGVSVEDQTRADERIPDLLATPAAVRFLSCEPLLGPVSLARWIEEDDDAPVYSSDLDWVIVGGESGPGARPMHPDWARTLRHQCYAADIEFHFKQWGEWAPTSGPDGFWPHNTPSACRLMPNGERHPRGLSMQRIGKKAAGRLLDGVEHNGMPA